MFGDFVVVVTSGTGSLLLASKWAEASDAVKYPTMHRTVSPPPTQAKNNVAQSVKGAKEKLRTR